MGAATGRAAGAIVVGAGCGALGVAVGPPTAEGFVAAGAEWIAGVVVEVVEGTGLPWTASVWCVALMRLALLDIIAFHWLD